MIARTIKKTVGSLSLLLAVAFGAVAPANAIVVSGSWDPWYGSPFLGSNDSSEADDMWWSGSALFTIPDTAACAATSGNAYQVTCSGMTVSSAMVKLSQGDLLNGGTLLNTLAFGGTANLTKVQFANNGTTVLWVESNWWNPLVSGSGTVFNLQDYYFSVGFSEAGANLFHTEKGLRLDAHGSHGPDQKTFFWNGEGNGHMGDLCGPANYPFDGDRCGVSDNMGVMVFAPIPEPSTYALMFAGLAAVGFMARRRRQQPV